MNSSPDLNLPDYCAQVARQAREASRGLASLIGHTKNQWLERSAAAIQERTAEILAENQLDLQAAPKFGLTEAAIDRLRLTPSRIEAIRDGLLQIAMLPNPIGAVIDSAVRPNGLRIDKVRVPLGVVFFIYESRPNVTADAAAICVKSGNAVILRGGKEAAHSNAAIARILGEVAAQCGLPPHAVQLVATPDRAAVGHFLKLNQWIDVAIPRGGEALIRRVCAEAAMPVIKHFDGNCHVYIDRSADIEMAESITINAKCQRLGVCNAAESLLVHAEIAPRILPRLAALLTRQGIEIRGDDRTIQLVSGTWKADEDDYRREFLGPIISCKVVDSLAEAIAHINEYGSGHTDAIITQELAAAEQFTAQVDSAAVMVNASTRFNDGAEFGLGAEIGISTDKFHARGPCGLNELASYKYIVHGSGQIRS